MKILLIKTSSLGDVVHNLPVVNDMRSAIDDCAIDWAVEKTLADVPALHPAVRRIVPCELRRWRKSWYAAQTRREWSSFLHDLRLDHYDAIIDTQGLLKSAIVARSAIGKRFGLDWRSSREPLRVFYDRTFRVPREMHAVVRNRRLCGLALGYEPVGAPDYGIACAPAAGPWLRPPFVAFLHATSHPRKLWPISQWIELGEWAASLGLGIVLPWGSEVEQRRAHALSERLRGAVVITRLSLAELAQVLAAARGVVGVDTGLTHLAAALGVPTVGIYGATDPNATGVLAGARATNVGSLGQFPSVQQVVDALVRVWESRSPFQAN